MQLRKGCVAALVLCVFVGSVGMSGCADSGGEIDVAYMAGTYNLDKITETPAGGATMTLVPPYIEGTITLTDSGTFSYNYIIVGNPVSGLGTFTVDDPEIVFNEYGEVKGIVSNVTHGVISNGGDTIIVAETGSERSFSWEVTRKR